MVATIGERCSHCTSFNWLRFATFELFKLALQEFRNNSSSRECILKPAAGEFAGWLGRGRYSHCTSLNWLRFATFELFTLFKTGCTLLVTNRTNTLRVRAAVIRDGDEILEVERRWRQFGVADLLLVISRRVITLVRKGTELWESKCEERTRQAQKRQVLRREQAR